MTAVITNGRFITDPEQLRWYRPLGCPRTLKGTRLLWHQGYQALAQAEESGYRSNVPTVWASAVGSDRGQI